MSPFLVPMEVERDQKYSKLNNALLLVKRQDLLFFLWLFCPVLASFSGYFAPFRLLSLVILPRSGFFLWLFCPVLASFSGYFAPFWHVLRNLFLFR